MVLPSGLWCTVGGGRRGGWEGRGVVGVVSID